jgi:predicted ABC-type ATPase
MGSSLYIVAGPNGAGKTTFAREFLPNYVECLEFVNADLIASGLSPFSPERAAMRAGRLMLERIHFLADRATDFGFETTLSGKSYVRLLKDLKSRGYRIYLYFLWVDNVDIALERVAERVQRGGHNVPENIVRRRFNRGLPNLFIFIVRFWTSGLYLTIQQIALL